MSLSAGARLGPYEILSALGAGGMGEVYRARDTRLDRTVAVKILPAALSIDPQFRERFDREARAISQLTHPHICTLHDVGEHAGTAFLVMEQLDGETLASRLAKGALPPAQALTIAIEIASALDAAHRAGIVHRDLKPGNVMLTRAGAKLLDFGLAKTSGSVVAAGVTMAPTTPAGVTAQGTILGTFQYMAPEQIEGVEADARTDLFAFGCLLFEMLTGKRAFDGKTQASLIGAIMKDEPPPISQVQPIAPAALNHIVARCLAKDPADRWQSARDLMHELQWISQAGSQAGAAASAGVRRSGRERVWMALAGSLLLTTGPIFIGSLDSSDRTKLLDADSTNVVYTQGHVLFLRDKTLMAQPFDPKRLALTGEPFPIAQQIQTLAANPTGVFSASDNGVLAYQTGAGSNDPQLVWLDRSGARVATVGDAGRYADLQLSPDGLRAAVSAADNGNVARDIWLFDLARGFRTRFTFDPADEWSSTWTPDGSRLVFNSRRKGRLDLYQKAANGAGAEELLLEGGGDKAPLSISPDGRHLLYAITTGDGSFDLWILPLTGDRKPFPFLNTPFNEVPGAFSPDGRWIAYASNELGHPEVFVAPFPGPGGKWQVSTAGGNAPKWSRDGKELFYVTLAGNQLMSASVNGTGSNFQVGAVQPLFAIRPGGVRSFYEVSPDGQRFLVVAAPEPRTGSVQPVTVVVNWQEELKQRVPTR